jgi:itaconyl-CoA hydratase
MMAENVRSNGRCYEDFTEGEVYRHPLGRTISETDNTWFTLLTVNTNPIHFDAHYAAQTEFGRLVVNSALTLALVTGLSVADVSQYGVNLGWDEVRMPAPVFVGDTLYAQTEVLAKRESKSRPQMGVLTIRTTGFKSDGTVVMEFKRTLLVYKRAHLPSQPLPNIHGQ